MTRGTTLFLAGDVMTGRGVDQILACPGNPELREQYLHDARDYARLAAARHGAIPTPVDPTWPWGAALSMLDTLMPDARVINLETSITRSSDFAPGKAVHYRMNPANLPCLTAAHPDVCVLANNHVLDFGRLGLAETLEVLAGAGLRVSGAGRDERQAREPAIVPLSETTRLVVLACGTRSSGIPGEWAAKTNRSGVHLLPDLSPASADAVIACLDAARRPGDATVVSIHWGSNWGYDVDSEQRAFAHRLIDGGVDVIHGHSSHHPQPIELYRGRVILYGCGDLINDYEGIGGHAEYRADLRLMYVTALERGSGRLARLRLLPLRARRLRLERASAADTEWMRATLEQASSEFGTPVAAGSDGMLTVPVE